MRRSWLALAWLLAAVAWLLAPAVAQATEPQRRSPAARPSASRAAQPRGPDLFGGFSYTHAGEADLYGWHVSGSLPFQGALRLVGDLSGHYGSFAGTDLSQLTFLAGLRLAPRGSGSLNPFLHALFGGARTTAGIDVIDVSISESDTDWGGALGGGVDYRLSRRWAVRLQGDALLLRAEGAWDTNPRLSVGAVYRFNR